MAKGGFGDDETEPFEQGDNLPLFSGGLETMLCERFDEDTPTTLQGQGYNGFVRLTFPNFFLNPLRFVRHQSLPTENEWGKAKWFKNPLPANTHGEFSFTNDDNWIPSTLAWEAFASSNHWQRHLKRYIGCVTKVIRNEIVEALSKLDSDEFLEKFEFGHLIECQDYKIRELETVWEFEDSDPCERVRSLKQPLMDLGRGELSASTYRGQLNLMRHKGEETKEFNSTGIRVKLRTGIELRVYPKTNKRVRFEIIQRDPSRAKLLEAAKMSFGDDEKRYSEIPAMFKEARQIAANMLNNVVFPAIASKPNLRIRQLSVVGFLADFAKASANARSLRDVISMLISNGTIQVGVPGKPLPQEMVEIIHRLKGTKKANSKLIVWSAPRNGYEVAPRYRWALEQLRAADDKMTAALLGSAPPRKR